MTASDITLLRSASDASQSTSSSLVKETGLKKPRTSLTTLDNVGGAFFGFPLLVRKDKNGGHSMRRCKVCSSCAGPHTASATEVRIASAAFCRFSASAFGVSFVRRPGLRSSPSAEPSEAKVVATIVALAHAGDEDPRFDGVGGFEEGGFDPDPFTEDRWGDADGDTGSSCSASGGGRCRSLVPRY